MGPAAKHSSAQQQTKMTEANTTTHTHTLPTSCESCFLAPPPPPLRTLLPATHARTHLRRPMSCSNFFCLASASALSFAAFFAAAAFLVVSALNLATSCLSRRPRMTWSGILIRPGHVLFASCRQEHGRRGGNFLFCLFIVFVI